MEVFQRTSPWQKKLVSVLIPVGSRLQRTGLAYSGKEKKKRLMIHVAEHRCSGIVLPWSYFCFLLFWPQSDIFFLPPLPTPVKGYTWEWETGVVLREDGELHCPWQMWGSHRCWQFSIGFWHQTSEQTTLSLAARGWSSSDTRAEGSEVGRDLEWMVRKRIIPRKHVLIRTRL